MCYVHWGTVGAAMLTASTLTFAAPNGEPFNNDTNGTLNDDSRNGEMRDGEMRDSETRSCSEVADGPRQLSVRMIDGGMKAAVLALARDEVTAIWKQCGIEIVWEGRWTPTRPKPDLWVQFVDIALQSKRMHGAPAVAWIPFADGVPMPPCACRSRTRRRC